MSYELIFWRQTPAQTKSPLSVHESLMNEIHVDGLVELPIDGILSRVMHDFPGTVRESNGPSEWLTWVSQNEKDSFEVAWSRQHVRVDCRHLHSDQMNQLIEIGAAFGCPLFDPQTNERFSQVDE